MSLLFQPLSSCVDSENETFEWTAIECVVLETTVRISSTTVPAAVVTLLPEISSRVCLSSVGPDKHRGSEVVGKARRRSGSRNNISRAHLPFEAAISLFLVFGHHYGTKYFNCRGGKACRECRRTILVVCIYVISRSPRKRPRVGEPAACITLWNQTSLCILICGLD
jgi:hypothetical protein